MTPPSGVGGLARPHRILLVEDDPAEARLLEEAFELAGGGVTLERAADGEAALARLRSGGDRIDLLLLPLHLPGPGGRELLAELKGSPETRRIPALVLSSGGSEADVLATWDAHANAFLRKPGNLDDLAALAGSIRRFWLRSVQLPG
jgi:two-component system, chemotaxis family, response regulator Rcp1